MFEYPTVRGLSAVAGLGPATIAEQGLVQGPVPLTPIQHWFFQQNQPEPHHYNQSVILAATEAPNRAWLAAALAALIGHHDALRLRFERIGVGWSQTNAGLEDVPDIEELDLSNVADSELPVVLLNAASAVQARLDLTRGPVVRVALFELGANRGARLLIVVHHLAVDAVSWRILLEDFQRAYEQQRKGIPIVFPAKTTSYKEWAHRLVQFAQSEEMSSEADYWHQVADESIGRIPIDSNGGDVVADEGIVTVTVGADEARALMEDVPSRHQITVEEVLLASLGETLARWAGASSVLIDLEGHGREDLFDDVDVTRTVGWFTTMYPLRLERATDGDWAQAVASTRARLRSVPRRGIGYGALRYLHHDAAVRQKLEVIPAAEICFNYLGQFGQNAEGETMFSAAADPAGAEQSPLATRTHLLEVSAMASGGKLRIEIRFGQQMHNRQTIERLAAEYVRALQSAVTALLASAPGAVAAAADFGWRGDDIEQLLSEIDAG